MTDLVTPVTNPHDLPIEGWAHPHIFALLQGLMGHPDPWFRAGPICEIGVHHGKFLITAHNVLGGPPTLGIDVFEDRARNVDNSGEGSLLSFQANVHAHAAAPEAIRSWQADSLELTWDDAVRLRDQIGRVRLFSIDGGHTPVHVLNDYAFAEQVTAQDGMIVVDDFCNPHWPGVNEGLARLYLNGQPRFTPFLFLENKLFLVGHSLHRRALESVDFAMQGFRHRYDLRPVSFYGHAGLSALGV